VDTARRGIELLEPSDKALKREMQEELQRVIIDDD
jgi:hypothetical protein